MTLDEFREIVFQERIKVGKYKKHVILDQEQYSSLMKEWAKKYRNWFLIRDEIEGIAVILEGEFIDLRKKT